jgi:hypothetical protein
VLGAGQISQVTLEQVGKAEPGVRVVRNDPYVIPEEVRCLGVLALADEDVLWG